MPSGYPGGVHASETHRRLEVGPEDAGARLDAFLAQRLRLSRAEARRLLAGGYVAREGRRLDLRHKGMPLVAGARLAVADYVPPASRRVRPEPESPLPVLARGPGWIALDKAPGQPVHPLREDEGATLLNALVARHPEIQGVGEGGLRSGVVHRLDVDTSGVVLFATQEGAWERLRQAFRRHRVAKRYRALVVGALRGAGEEHVALQVSRHRPARVRVVAPGTPGSRLADLRWRSLEVLGDVTLLEIEPRTGFLHQIRTSLAHRGHPVLGDTAYGGANARVPVPRQMLHAASVALDEVRAESPDPPDLAATLARLRA